MIIKMLNKLGRRLNEYSEKFSKELENIKKKQIEHKKSNNWNLKYTINRRNQQCTSWYRGINWWTDRVVEIIQAEQKKKRIF